MNKLALAALCAILLASCQDNNILQSPTDSPDIESTKNRSQYAITPDSALAYLDAFMNTTPSLSRSGAKKTVSSISPIRYKNSSRSNYDDLDCENLVYVANFDDEQGYAILAADTRIDEKVIAVTDEGSLDDATVYSAMELANSERAILEEYPISGPGFFTLPEYGDELFMNPNTVSLYDETVGDTLVGNFSLDNIGAEDESGTPIADSQDDNSECVPEILTSSLCTEYAIAQIKEYNEELDSQTDNEEILDTDNEDAIVTETKTSSAKTKTETTYSNWTTKKITSNILSNYCYWHQHSPFNDSYPKRRRYLIFGHKKKAPAGCFPLAIAKILTHFEYPSVYMVNDHIINWKGLKSSCSKGNAGIDKKSAAALLRSISNSCDSWYFYAGTFTFPHKATSFMRHIGLSNAHSHGYSFNRVTDMIDEGKPLLIYSVPGINVLKSHCWNIDGYKVKERTVYTKKYRGKTLISSSSKTETCNMVHCDFGWQGNCNGYYVSGVFKLNRSNRDREPDDPFDKGDNVHYNHLLKVITYNKP